MAINTIDKNSLHSLINGLTDPSVKQDRKNCVDNSADLNTAVQCLKIESYLFTPSAIAGASTDLTTAISANIVGSNSGGGSSGPSLTQVEINALISKFGTSACTNSLAPDGTVIPPSAAREECCFRKYLIENMVSLKTGIEGLTGSVSWAHNFASIDCSTL